MLFNSFNYLVFLPIVVGLYWAAPASFRLALLLLASYFFYMSWIPAYGLLLITLTAVNYLIGLMIWRCQSRRKALLILGLSFNLGCLIYYKYTNFLVESVWQVTTWLNHCLHLSATVIPANPAFNILLPLGISFFVFEFIHYITDIYRGSPPIKNFWHFALFAAFFPSQIAGPIKRFQDFGQQLKIRQFLDSKNFRQGLFLIFQGLFKKIVLGDNLGVLVNAAYNHLDRVGTTDAWIATIGFLIQIFCDFSGYTDIGRGSALLFGYKVPENFNWPFLAPSIIEFWRRWHMSLSNWLRDYLFIPLGGSRVPVWRVCINVVITMMLAGLWHGAAWHFVVFGAMHGAALIATRTWQHFADGVSVLRKIRPHPLWHWTSVVSTFLFVAVTAIFFRAESNSVAMSMLPKLFTPAASGEVTRLLLESTLPVSLSLYGLYLLLRLLNDRIEALAALQSQDSHALAQSLPSACLALRRWWDDSLPARVVAYASLAIVILGFAPGKVEPFIYFQF